VGVAILLEQVGDVAMPHSSGYVHGCVTILQ